MEFTSKQTCIELHCKDILTKQLLLHEFHKHSISSYFSHKNPFYAIALCQTLTFSSNPSFTSIYIAS